MIYRRIMLIMTVAKMIMVVYWRTVAMKKDALMSRNSTQKRWKTIDVKTNFNGLLIV